jgi:phosphohistidine phosphatase
MDVILVRHAIALDRDEATRLGMTDRERPLTAPARSRMLRTARGLATRVPNVSLLLTSPLRRAAATAEILQKQYKALRRWETNALLPDADPTELAPLLADEPFQSTVLAVGHEPHLSCWAGWCLTGDPRGFLELRRAGACGLRFENGLGPSQARLLWLLTPAVLRRL